MKITVSQAASQLGVVEEIYRLAMAEIKIPDADTITEIDLDIAAMIAEVVSAQVNNQALLPSTDRPLPVEAQEQIISGVQSVFIDFEECINIKPEEVTIAIAYLKAIRSAQAYREIFLKTFNDEVGSFNLNLQDALLQSVADNDVAKMTQDFLNARGVRNFSKNDATSRHKAIMTELSNLVNQVK